MQRWWRTWRRNWAKFDLIALGGGFALSALYVWLRETNPGLFPPSVFDIWADIAGGILGAWLGVRLLDRFIEAREKREQVRRNLISNLNFISAEARRLLPKVYDFNLTTLEVELRWMEERFENRKRYLSDDERVRVETVITQQKTAIRAAHTYVAAAQDVRTRYNAVDDAATLVNNALHPFEKHLRELERQSPVDPAAVAALDAQIGQGSPALYPQDAAAIRAFLIALAAPNRPPGVFIPVPNLTYVRLYDADWFKQVERAYNELRDIPTYAPATLAAVISTAQTHLKSDPLPAPAQIAVENYLTSVTRLGAERAALEAALRSLNSSIDSAVRDIMEESELD